MPSPTDSTWPISETSASLPKFLIWSLRIEEISAARISMIASSLKSLLVSSWRLSRRAASLKCGRRRTRGRACQSAGSLQHDLQVHQLGLERGIEHAAADLDDEAAEQRGVHLGVDPHRLAVS